MTLQLQQPVFVIATRRRNGWELKMPQMFDWIFFAIILMPTVALVWDWLRNR